MTCNHHQLPQISQARASPSVLATLFFQLRGGYSGVPLWTHSVSAKVDLANQTLLTKWILEAGKRKVAMIASLSLPQTVTWLNCPPMPILGLHLRALSLLSPPKSGWECLIKLGQAKANVKLTHTPANQVQILFRHTDIKTEVNISPQNQYFFMDPRNGPARESRSWIPGTPDWQ